MKGKAVRAGVFATVITALLMLLATTMLPKEKPVISGTGAEEHTLYSDSVQEQALIGYVKDGTALTQVSSDPQIWFDTQDCGSISAVTLMFSQSLRSDLDVQVFYDIGSGYSEENSVRSTCEAGDKRTDILIPEGAYKQIRVDVNGSSIPLQTITAWSGRVDLQAKEPDFPWVLCAVITVILLFSGFLLMKGSGTLQKRSGFILAAFAVSTLFVLLMKTRMGIADAFRISQPDKMLVSISDIAMTMLAIFFLASFFPAFRTLFALPKAWFTGTEKTYLGLCALVYCFWILTFPSNSYGPDEYMRYDIPKFIYQTGALPYGWEESIRNPYWGVSYGFDISLPYLMSSYLMSIMSLYSDSGALLLIAARMASLISTVGTAAMAILVGKKLMNGKPARWIFVVMISMLPQIVFLSSYVNLDSFSLTTVMMIVYCWINCLREKWSVRSCCWLAAATALCFLSYKFAYGYILMSAVLYIVWYIMNRRTFSFIVFVRRGMMIIGIALVLCGWKFIRNAILYNGDFLSLNASKPYAELYAVEAAKPSSMVTNANSGVGLIEMLRVTPWIQGTSESLIGVFGYLNITMPRWFYRSYNILLLSGIIASLTLLLPGKKKTGNGLLLFTGMGLASLAAVAVSVYFSWSGDFQAQGRYVITILPFVTLMVSMGFDRILEIIGKLFLRRPETERQLSTVFSACVSGFVIFTMIAGYIRCLQYFGILNI